MPGMEARAPNEPKREGIFLIAELFAGDFLHLADILVDLCHYFGIDLATVLIILGAGLGGHGEALGHGKTDVGHFGKVCAFTAQKLSCWHCPQRKDSNTFCSF